MTEGEVHRCLVHRAEALAEQLTVLEENFPQDEEGFPIYDNSDLSDALKAIRDTETVLSRLAFKIAREGITKNS